VKLTAINGKFITHADGRSGTGVRFNCQCRPDCDEFIAVSFENPVDGGVPDPSTSVRWDRKGSTLDTLTLSPSINFTHVIDRPGDPLHGKKCNWHGWVRDGSAVIA
jgi:hypothetical protein